MISINKTALVTAGMTAIALLSGCSSTPLKGWTTEKSVDSFYGNTACNIRYLDPYRNSELNMGTRYYPFVMRTADGKMLFGIENNRNEPVGDVLVKIDSNPPVRISQSETEVQEGISYQMPVAVAHQSSDMQEILQYARVVKSPITTASEAKSRRIINQIRIGDIMRIRVIGLGVNGSSDIAEGEYPIDQNLIQGYSRCGL